jgi:hypothetical protein
LTLLECCFAFNNGLVGRNSEKKTPTACFHILLGIRKCHKLAVDTHSFLQLPATSNVKGIKDYFCIYYKGKKLSVTFSSNIKAGKLTEKTRWNA